jgi:hypothetical protein
MIAYLLIAFVALSLTAIAFVRINPRHLALALKLAGPVLLGLLGLVLLILGRVGVAMTLLGIAAAVYRYAMRSSPVDRDAPRHSYVRTAALEMELDLDTNEMNGMVLAGRQEGRELNALSEPELHGLREELASDAESLQLLEAYLDRRVPGWRDGADADTSHGLGGAPGTGPMTEQEAYEILGLGAGATEAEIRQAHRRLMKGVHPDAGGSVFLAARINEAKDFLLRRHRQSP